MDYEKWLGLYFRRISDELLQAFSDHHPSPTSNGIVPWVQTLSLTHDIMAHFARHTTVELPLTCMVKGAENPYAPTGLQSISELTFRPRYTGHCH